MRLKRPLAWFIAPLAAGSFLLLVWLERRRPLRREVEPKMRREIRNVAVAALGAVSMQLVEAPITSMLARRAEVHGWGVLPRLRLPRYLEIAVALILMDYTFYVWHVLNHRAPILWRFHVVHHSDLDLDASTALRFHFGELIASVPWRAAQIVLIGLTPALFLIWQVQFLAAIVFHHSNLRLPADWERRLNYLIVTPRMHGIHHSVVRAETDSNWSSGLTVWDWLHGTLRLNVPQDDITIGVPAYRDPESVAFPKLITMPLDSPEGTWIPPAI